MQYSVLDAAGDIEARVEAGDVRQACRVWARRFCDETLIEEEVAKARLFTVSDQVQGAHLDPYVIAPAGSEKECLRKNREVLHSDVHFAPDPPQGDSRLMDTGGRG